MSKCVYDVMYDSGTRTTMTAHDISQLSQDLLSWARFAVMAMGGPPAVMTVHMKGPGGETSLIKVAPEGALRTGTNFEDA